LNIVYLLLGISPASNCSWPTFWNPVSVPSSKTGCTVYTQPLKMELIQGSETSANYNLTPGKYPKENTQRYKLCNLQTSSCFFHNASCTQCETVRFNSQFTVWLLGTMHAIKLWTTILWIFLWLPPFLVLLTVNLMCQGTVFVIFLSDNNVAGMMVM